jgi:hypothetical protein
MLVRTNYGWKAGQIQDIEPVAARAMLADGRATAVSYEAAADPGTVDSVDAAVERQQANAKPSKRNR